MTAFLRRKMLISHFINIGFSWIYNHPRHLLEKEGKLYSQYLIGVYTLTFFIPYFLSRSRLHSLFCDLK